MEYRFLGNTGLKVSSLSLGAWVTMGEQIDLDLSYKIMSAAFENGINFFDNAEAYAAGEAEIVMGKVIKKAGMETFGFGFVDKNILGRQWTE
jgi:aryl-alcohol dehydrogenase-like predicted oxidoreductase